MAQSTVVKTDYLSFDSASIKRLILQRLSENPHFTDFIFNDSNLITLVDIFAHTFQVLTYYLNHSASESLFSDAQIYENINRMVKFIGYNPRGYATAVVEAAVAGFTGTYARVLPKYSQVAINATDANGKQIRYSTANYYYISPSSSGNDNNIIMYNGVWRLYERTFVSTGDPNETLILNNLISDTDKKKYIAFPYVDVFVKRIVNNATKWYTFEAVETGLFINQTDTRIYKPTDRIFELRLNENKAVTLRFGDGVYGEKLQFGDEIYIAYLESNGPDGSIGAETLDSSSTKGVISYGIAGMTSATFNEIFSDQSVIWLTTADLNDVYVTNSSASSLATTEESVEEIRNNAPKWFKSVGLLRSSDDIENFIWRNYFKNIDSVKVMNNWAYLASFFRWLYNLELATGNSYITNDLKTRYGYVWADSCDFNNMYLFVQFKETTTVSQNDIHDAIQPLKITTSETVFLDPLLKYFVPCALSPPTGYSTSGTEWDSNLENYIEILVDENSMVSPEIVQGKVVQVITQFFASENNAIGGTLDFNALTSDITSIDGVKRIRTIYKSIVSGTPEQIINGLRFACWSNVIVAGADLDYITGSYKLEDFQFPKLLETDISPRVRVITDSILGLTNIEY